MARPLRIELAGGLYHVTSRGDRREDIYRDEQDRVEWLAVFDEVCDRFNWRCHAYCLMTNNYHFVVETPDANLSKGMRHLNGVYTQRTNRRHSLAGHLFQGRFKAILVERDAYLLELARYVVLNPVRARMVGAASDWLWSSYRAMIGQAHVPAWLETDWLLAQFGSERVSSQAGYAAFVAQGTGHPDVWQGLRNQVFLGSDAFVKLHCAPSKPSGRLQEVPRAQRRALAKPLDDFARRYPERREAMAHAYQSGAYSMQEIGDYFGVHYATVSRAVRQLTHGSAPLSKVKNKSNNA